MKKTIIALTLVAASGSAFATNTSNLSTEIAANGVIEKICNITDINTGNTSLVAKGQTPANKGSITITSNTTAPTISYTISENNLLDVNSGNGVDNTDIKLVTASDTDISTLTGLEFGEKSIEFYAEATGTQSDYRANPSATAKATITIKCDD